MKKVKKKKLTERDRLRAYDLFAGLCDKEFDYIADNLLCKVYQRGSTVYQENCHIEGVYIILSGIIKQVKSGNKGRELIIRFAQGGDMIGFRSVLTKEPACATSEVMEKAVVCYLPGEVLSQVMTTNSDFALCLMRKVCRELEDSQMFILNIAQKKVRERMADVLIHLKDQFQLDYDNSLKIPLSRKELASAVGTAPESAIRMLTDFRKERLVDVQGRQIRLLNVQKLTRIGCVSM